MEEEASTLGGSASHDSSDEANGNGGGGGGGDYDNVDDAVANVDAPEGSISRMMALFAPPAPPPAPLSLSASIEKPSMVERQSTAPRSNRRNDISNNNNNNNNHDEFTPLLGNGNGGGGGHGRQNSLTTLLNMGSNNNNNNNNTSYDTTPKTRGKTHHHISHPSHARMPSAAMPAIGEKTTFTAGLDVGVDNNTNGGNSADGTNNSISTKFQSYLKSTAHAATQPRVYIGSFMYVLYHVVFCLALGSAIIRPNSSTSILGLMTKTAALGTLSSSAVYWVALSSDVPALYPTADLFLAPFMAHLAVEIDEVLAADPYVTEEDNDTVFLATFSVLAGIGICFSGTLLVLASAFKLANLGSFLPFPVICGFFSAVGIMTWTLAITVDTGGKSIGQVLWSGDSELIMFTIVHHVPGVIVASIMKYLGPKNPFFVIMVVLSTISLFYIIMFVTGVSLEEAKEMGWFWSHEELVYESSEPTTIGFKEWAPPAPFGMINQIIQGSVHWGAVLHGMKTSVALGFLYLIRCSVHGTALKKNITNLARKAQPGEEIVTAATATGGHKYCGSSLPGNSRPLIPKRARKFSEMVDIEAVMQPLPGGSDNGNGTNDGDEVVIIRAKPTNITLKDIFNAYGCSQFVSALVGGFAVTPSVAASGTMFALGADGVAPQIGSALLLLAFYLTDFQLVGYIPKPAFSSMLVLAFIDMIYTWFYKSYFKTKDKTEWLVVPAIVVCAFAFDLLSAIFLGIAFSTFIFVASFFRSGVVRYVANGVAVHSTIERPFKSSEWLNENGDTIQIVVLQNYLFFGNASAVFAYIDDMFRQCNDTTNDNGDPTNSVDAAVVTNQFRKPKFYIIDLALVTGMDTSTVDVFGDIRTLCKSNDCKLLMTGMSPNIRSILSLGGFKADTGERSKRHVRFFASLDAALGKAEDLLLEEEPEANEHVSFKDSRRRLLSEGDFGFRTALRHIDEEHGDQFSLELVKLQEHTNLVELNPGDSLYGDGSAALERGLFFIECGVMKIHRDTGDTATRGSLRSLGNNNTSLNNDSAKRWLPFLNLQPKEGQGFRLARIGPGWVAGTLEAVSGVKSSGDHIAVTHCRLHHLPFSKIQEVERNNPALILTLYKLLSYLLARRQEATIGQLATLHSIMTSPTDANALQRRNIRADGVR